MLREILLFLPLFFLFHSCKKAETEPEVLDIRGATTSTETLQKLEVLELAIDPPGGTFPAGARQGFKALATLEDGTSLDITTQVVWEISGDAVSADVEEKGYFYFDEPGTSQFSIVANGNVTATAEITVTDEQPVELKIAPTNPVVRLGETIHFSVIGIYDDETSLDLTAHSIWSRSDEIIIDLEKEDRALAKVTGKAQGSTTITASVGELLASTKVFVSDADISELRIVGDDSLARGLTMPLRAEAVFTDATSFDVTERVTWSSSDEDLATVDDELEKGLMSGLAMGDVVVSASFDDLTATKDVTITDISLVSIEVTMAETTLYAHTNHQASATGTFSDGSTQDLTQSVTWNSDDETVATVNNGDSKGLVTAQVKGTTNINAAADGITGSIEVTVPDIALLSIAVTPDNHAMPAGLTQQYVATGTYADNSTFDVTANAVWTSSDEIYATLSSSALASGVAVGQSTISAAIDSVSGNTALTITSAVAQSIVIKPAEASVPAGMTQQFTLEGTFSDGSVQDITAGATWSATGEGDCATISNTNPTEGLATSVAEGSCDIHASFGGLDAAPPAELTVTEAVVTSVTVTPQSATVASGQTQQYNATATYSDGSTEDVTNTATWNSSDTGVGTIDSNGLATSIAPISTTITATFDEISDDATLLVDPPALVAIAVTPETATITYGETQQFTATGTYTDGSTADITATAQWSSSDNGLATIAAGLASTTGIGSPTLTASLDGVSDDGILTITPQDPPPDPTGLSASVDSNSQITLTWSSGGQTTTGFKVAYQPGATAPANCNSGSMINSASSPQQVTSLLAGTQYSFRVCAFNGNPTPDFSAGMTVSDTTLPNAPDGPANFTATAISQTQIDLSWNDTDGEDNYVLEWSANGSSGWSAVSNPAQNATSENHTGLTADTQYFYRIKAVNTGGESAYSYANTRTLPNPPADVTGFTATTVSQSKIDLAWNDVVTETGYKIEWSLDSNNWTSLSNPAANVTSLNHTGLNANTQYFYRIKATNAGGESPNWVTADATTLPEPPGAPANFTATATSQTEISLSWDDTSGETGYVLEWSADGSTNWQLVSNLAANSNSDDHASLTADTMYYYRLKATNPGGDSAYATANVRTLKDPPPTPQNFTATPDSGSSMRLAWSDTSDETGYTVEWSADGSSNWQTVATPGANITTATHSNLSPGTRYYYRLKASNSGGDSGYRFVDEETPNNLTEAGCNSSGGVWGTSLVANGACDWLYNTPGTYSWTVPVGVTQVSVVAVGGGGGGGAAYYAGSGGGGGGLAYKTFSVNPGEVYQITVGAGGTSRSASSGGMGTAGGDSSVVGPNANFTAGGGGAGIGTSASDSNTRIGGAGGAPSGDYDGGASGGTGGNTRGDDAGAGGGAAGYSGNGGNANYDGSGGGGGGGRNGGDNWRYGTAGSGGGVGVFGQGANGAAGQNYTGAAGGSGGATGSKPYTLGGSGNAGGAYGGGGGGQSDDSRSYPGCHGGKGAVRIIWGAGRAFPSTLTGTSNGS